MKAPTCPKCGRKVLVPRRPVFQCQRCRQELRNQDGRIVAVETPGQTEAAIADEGKTGG